MSLLKFISFTALITWQFSTTASAPLDDIEERRMIQDVLKKMDDQLSAPSYTLLLKVLEKSQSGQTTTYTVEASSTDCIYNKKHIITGSDVEEKCSATFPVKKCTVTITDKSVEKGTAQCKEIDLSTEHFEPLNMLGDYPRKDVMARLRFILEETAEDNGYDVHRKIKSVDSVSQSGKVTKVQLTVTDTNCPVEGKNAYEGISVERDCQDMKKPYKCTILYVDSNGNSAKVDCAETVVNVEEEIDEESRVQNVLKNTDDQTNAESYTKLLKILYKIKSGTTTLYEIEASKSECTFGQRSSITGYAVLHDCPERFPVMTCTVTITDKSMETGSVECEEIDLSRAYFAPITPPYDYLMREIKNKAESILFEIDSEKESGVYKKLISIDAALKFGSVKKIQLTAADTDCKVAGENAYTGVDVADDCHELSALHQCTILYVDSPYAALLSCAQAA
ncbi:hypothetical protein T11_13062 [Trichinella zimbabwensis]|uniref:Uncharacterized protein n=1 Tax=Trichinella zimbabwensis TaxID=268475 RepID=A0A0V1H808_9BILA|nr:hypothetical protein T11_3559 [Trichinella zimbabwensis]KRZ06245.1 hypothetical protein T11_13062 [Trichinella zimbabwensis]